MTLMEIPGPSGSLHVDDGGSGDLAVVFVHAFGGNTTHWAAQLEFLRKKRRAAALDLRGHGLSQPSADGGYRVVQYSKLSVIIGLSRYQGGVKCPK